MEFIPTDKPPEEIALEMGLSCKSDYSSDRVTHHSVFRLTAQRILYSANIHLRIYTYKCEKCSLTLDVVRKLPKNNLPEDNPAERCVCGHLRLQHYHTYKDGIGWYHSYCQHRNSHYEDDCQCRKYERAEAGAVRSLPTPEVEDVQRSE